LKIENKCAKYLFNFMASINIFLFAIFRQSFESMTSLTTGANPT